MSKIFRHFPNLKMTMNGFTEAITNHKVEEYEDKLQGLLEELQVRFDDLPELKPRFTCLVCQHFVTDISAAETELTKLPEDLALKNFIKCHSTVEFWEQVTESKY